MTRPTKAVYTFTREPEDAESYDVAVPYDYTSGSPETGRFGRPEDYDPGSGPDILLWNNLAKRVDTGEHVPLTDAEQAAAFDWIEENPPEEEAPDYEDDCI